MTALSRASGSFIKREGCRWWPRRFTGRTTSSLRGVNGCAAAESALFFAALWSGKITAVTRISLRRLSRRSKRYSGKVDILLCPRGDKAWHSRTSPSPVGHLLSPRRGFFTVPEKIRFCIVRSIEVHLDLFAFYVDKDIDLGDNCKNFIRRLKYNA